MKALKKLETYISKSVGRAIVENALIEDGDKVIVGVSGGKDSLTLLKILALRKKWVPIKHDIVACHVLTNNMCAGCKEIDTLKKYFDELDCDYIFEKSEIVNEKTDFSCFWCAWNRRKTLFNLAQRVGAGKVALGHHMDDIAETMLMNLFFHGEISSLNSKQPLFKGKIAIIRPMVYLEEKKISDYARTSGLPNFYCNCPHAEKSKRHYMKDLIRKLESEFKYVKKNIVNAPHRIKKDYLGVKHG